MLAGGGGGARYRPPPWIFGENSKLKKKITKYEYKRSENKVQKQEKQLLFYFEYSEHSVEESWTA
jgi:hypothetical protein